MLGLTAGLIAAIHNSWWIRVLCGLSGAAAGYWIGLLAGIHAQRLGFVAIILDQFSVLGAIGLSIPVILLALPQ